MHPDELRGLIDLMEGVQAARYTSAAATTIYLYNILLTLDLEIEHIWSCLSFHLPTTLYIINRYVCLGFFLVIVYSLFPFHDGFSDTFCKFPFEAIGFSLAYVGWTGLMTLRVSALYSQKRWLIKLIRILWCLLMIEMIVLGYCAFREIEKTIAYNHLVRVCAPTITPYLFRATPIAPAAYELFLSILTILKALDFGVPLSSTTLPLLYRVLVRDGVLYFVASTTITVVNTIAWYRLPAPQLFLLCSVFWAVTSTMLAQLMLNLKVAHQQSVLEQLGTTGFTRDFTVEAPMDSKFLEYRSRFTMGDSEIAVTTSTRFPQSASHTGESGVTTHL